MFVPLIGPSVKSPVQDANYQRCVNFYPLNTGSNGRSSQALVPWSGLKELIDLGGQAIRGIARISNSTSTVYAVSDDSLYKVTVNTATETASSELIGSLTTSTGTVKFDSNPTQLILVDGTTGYIVTLATDTFTNITDSDFPNSTSVIFFDSYFVGNRPNTGQMQTSGLNDGMSWDALDTATAENKPDNVVALAQSRGEVWVFGNESVEVWDDTANPEGFPFSPRKGGALTQGCIAPYSVVEVNGIIIWLDDRKFIVQNGVSTYVNNQSSGFVATIISDDNLNNELATYTNVSDAIAFSFTERGKIFYQITFPTDRKTWVCDIMSSTWTERAYYSDYLGKNVEHFAQYGVTLGTTNIVGGTSSGKLYIMSPKYYTDSNEQIHRTKTCGPLAAEGRWVQVDEILLRVYCEALPYGQGSNPKIMLRYSNDGGHTWSNELMKEIGQIGVYGVPITWTALGTATEWLFEFSFSDPINIAFIEAVAEISIENKAIDKNS